MYNVQMPYKIHKSIVTTVLTMYLPLAVVVQAVTNTEGYPLFNWSLFSSIPNLNTEYAIEIYEIGTQTYSPPLAFSETKFLFDAISRSPTDYFYPIQRLGDAVTGNNQDSIRDARAVVEHVFLGKKFKYSLMLISYDPVAHWKTGEYKVIEKIGIFERE